MKEEEIYAVQQIIGYAHAKRGFSLKSLVESMGLSRDEWNNIRSDVKVWLTEDERKEVDAMMEGK